jgi:hypothetical protein
MLVDEEEMEEVNRAAHTPSSSLLSSPVVDVAFCFLCFQVVD